jgi:hypothetical protein
MASLLTHLILPLALAVIAVILLLRKISPYAMRTVDNLFGRRFWVGLAILLLTTYAAALFLMSYLPVVVDAVEANVASVSFLFLHGHPLYTEVSAPSRLSLLYGPLCDISYSVGYMMFGPTLLSAKLTVVILNLLLFTVIGLLFRKLLSRSETVIVLGCLAGLFLMKEIATLMIRGDVLIALAVALALLACEVRRTTLAAILFCVGSAAAVDVKFTAIVYLLVPLTIIWHRRGPHFTLWCIAVSTAIAAIPFAIPGIPIFNYLDWLREASHHPLSMKLFEMNAVAAVILLAPLMLFAALRRRTDPALLSIDLKHQALPITAFVLTVAGSVLVGSKVGAGRSHLIPTSLVSTYLAALLWKVSRVEIMKSPVLVRYFFLAYSFVLVLPATSQLKGLWAICFARHDYANQVLNDIDQVQQIHSRQTIEIGYDANKDESSTTNAATLFQPQLVLTGNPMILDAAALFDMGLSGIPIPRSTSDALASCQIQVWLIPKGGVPFSLRNTYARDVPRRFPSPDLFDDDFQSLFARHYRKNNSSAYYDIYECRA